MNNNNYVGSGGVYESKIIHIWSNYPFIGELIFMMRLKSETGFYQLLNSWKFEIVHGMGIKSFRSLSRLYLQIIIYFVKYFYG